MGCRTEGLQRNINQPTKFLPSPHDNKHMLQENDRAYQEWVRATGSDQKCWERIIGQKLHLLSGDITAFTMVTTSTDTCNSGNERNNKEKSDSIDVIAKRTAEQRASVHAEEKRQISGFRNSRNFLFCLAFTDIPAGSTLRPSVGFRKIAVSYRVVP